MHEAATQFIERLSLYGEKYGLPRIAGRMLGFFLIDGRMRSLDELADRLQISKGSASTNARLLERQGLLERHSRPGDRRDYYGLAEDPWRNMFEVARQRMQDMGELFETSRQALPPDMEEARCRLAEWADFNDFMLSDVDRKVEQWEARRTRNTPANEENEEEEYVA